MSRLVSALRKKKKDDAVVAVPSTNPAKRKKQLHRKKRDNTQPLSETQFQAFLTVFVNNKETISNLNKTNEEYKPKLVEYVKEKGAKDNKGHRIVSVGDIVAKVQVAVHRVLMTEQVEALIYKLRKKKLIKRSEAAKVVYAEHTVVLTDDQYAKLRYQLDEMGVISHRDVKVDEDQLNLLVAKGILSAKDVGDCYTEEERHSFVPQRIKEG